jgi:transposase
MVWGAIATHDRTDLVIIPPPGLTAQRYIVEVLRPNVSPLRLQYGRNFVFMQDNARPHTARITQQYFDENDINLLNHPAMSPDLNPIKHVWDMVGRRLRHRRVQPENLTELGQALREIWREIPQYLIRNCINMTQRCREVIRQRGGNTRY